MHNLYGDILGIELKRIGAKQLHSDFKDVSDAFWITVNTIGSSKIGLDIIYNESIRLSIQKDNFIIIVMYDNRFELPEMVMLTIFNGKMVLFSDLVYVGNVCELCRNYGVIQ